MENFESQQFRDNLAKEIKEAPKEERKDILDRAKETPEYQQAKGEKIKERQIEKLQEELNRMKESAIADGKMFYNENGEFQYALAPNGEKSRLGEKQWLETRSSSFKNWFGDWENATKPVEDGFTRIYRVEFSEEAIKKQKEERERTRKENPNSSWLDSAMKTNETLINQQNASQRYFGDSIEEVEWYAREEYFDGYKITYLDIPQDQIEQYRVSNIPLKKGGKDITDNPQAFSLRPEKEFYLPTELAQGRQEFIDASKFLDENDEPLVLYHGTTRNFDTFSHDAPKTFDLDNVKGAFFLTSDKKFAEAEYGKFKHNLIIDTLRKFNEVFFDGKATEWGVLIDKWNDFVRSAGTEKVNFKKEVPDGRGGHYSWTMVEFDGKPIFPTEEIEKIWDSKVPENFNEQDYEIDHWEGKEILLPKNSKQILMELFINSRNPNYKEVKSGNDQFEMDGLFAQGMIEKGVYATDKSTQHILSDPSFRSKPETDSVAVKLSNGQLAVAIFEASQAKSARGNNGLFVGQSANIYE